MSVLGEAVVTIRPETANFANEAKEKITSALHNPMVLAGAAVAAAGGIVEEFARRSKDRFKEVGGEVAGLVKVTGDSVESMSRLRFAGKETGVSVDTLAMGVKRLSLDITKHGDDMTKLGINYKDVHGKVLPMNDVLLNVSEKFKTMPNGVAKNSLAIQLFGKSGTDLIPILNKGKDGLAALEKQADKFGLTLTQNNLDALKKNSLAHKEFNAAIEGLQVQFGAHLLPALTAVTTFTNSIMVPVLLDASSFVRDTFGPSFDKGVALAEKASKAFMGYIVEHAPAVREQFEKIKAVAEPVFNRVTDAFRTVYQVIKDDVVPWLGDHLWPVLRDDLIPGFSNLAGLLGQQVGPAFLNFRGVAITSAVVGLGELAAALSDLQFLTFLTNPVLLAGTAVVGLIAGVGLLTSKGEDLGTRVRNLKNDFLEGLKAPAGANIDSFLGGVGSKVRDLVADLKDVGKSLDIAFKGLGKQTLGPPTDHASDQDLGVGLPKPDFGKTILEAVKMIDWKAVGKVVMDGFSLTLGTGAEAAVAISKAMLNLIGKIKWGDIGKAVGRQAPVLVLGLVTGLLNFDLGSLFKFVVQHWKEVLIGVIMIAFAPAKLIGALAKIPFIGSILKWLIEGFQGVVQPVLKFIPKIVGRIGEEILKAFGVTLHPGKMAQIASRLIDGFFEKAADFGVKVADFMAKLPEGILKVAGKVGETIGHVLKVILDALGGAGSWLFRKGVDILVGLVNGIDSRAVVVWDWFAGMPGRILARLGDAAGWLRGIGGDIVSGLRNGIADAWHLVTDKVRDLVQLIPKPIRDILKISSPSQVFHGFGVNMMEGWANGISDAGHLPGLALAGIANGLGSGLRTGRINTTALGGSMSVKHFNLNVTTHESKRVDVISDFKKMERMALI